MADNYPDFTYEEQTLSPIVFGLDEVGRGPLAGPVVAACVYIPQENRPAPIWNLVRDSKQLSTSKRDTLFGPITQNCHYAIGQASVEEIDSINILQATFLAMRRAIELMPLQPDHLLIDGNRLPKNWPWPAQSLIKGDSKSVSIAAASILAKVTRDHIMCDYAQDYPFFGWTKNAGYGTAQHISAINQYGITPHHRTSFAPIREYLNTRTG